MSKKKGGKGKKTDEDLENEIRFNLQLDIDTLENQIHLEELRELNALNDYERLIEATKKEQSEIETTKNDQVKVLSIKRDNLHEEEQKNAEIIKARKETIEHQDEQIDNLEKQIIEKRKIYQKAEDDRDEAIQNQRRLFQEMTVRFQHILENTANKLQERVKMGN
jgi:hypothetical protein